MLENINFISEEAQEHYELKKCHESVDKVNMYPHDLRDEVMLHLGGDKHILFTPKVAKLLLENKADIFDIFSIFKDLKYDYESGMYLIRYQSIRFNEKQLKDKKKKTILNL